MTALAVALCCAGSAQAGSMYVYSCHTPNGAPAGTAGWSHTTAPSRAYASNDCATGASGVLFARAVGSDPEWPAVWEVSWVFTAAPATFISGFSTAVCPQVASGYAVINWPGPNPPMTAPLRRFQDGLRTTSTMYCHGVQPYWADARNVIQRQGIATPQLWFVASCFICEGSHAGSIEISSFRADIRDDHAPVVTAVRGPLASSALHQGVEHVEFDVTDAGVGVYRAIVEARLPGQEAWREVSRVPLGGARATCAELDVTPYPYEFDAPQPCPLRIDRARVEFNTDSLGYGEHELRVSVEDASGNRSPVVTPRTFFAKGPAGVAPALSPGRPLMLRLQGAARRSLKAAQTLRLSGRLTELDGRPAAGVALAVRTRPFLPKPGASAGDWTALGQVVTGADGTFEARTPAGASRTVQFFREAGDGLAAVAEHVDVTVPAVVTARARSPRLRNGQSAVFRGRVKGPIPPGGVLVALEVREPGRWIPVATTRRWVRTTATGRFRLAYRFRRTFDPASYRFRVAAAEDSAFTYTRGVSRTMTVHVRP